MAEKHAITKLGEHNYPQWKPDMQAALMYKGCWRLVAGLWLQQHAEDAGDLDDWLDKQNMASGLIWQSLEQSQKALVQDLLADPVALWTRLGSLHAIESQANTLAALRRHWVQFTEEEAALFKCPQGSPL